MSKQELYETALGQEIVFTYSRERLTIKELADKYKVAQSAVRKTLLAYGMLHRSGKNYRYSEEDRREMARRYVEETVSLADLATEYGCSETTVHNAVLEVYGYDWKRKLKNKKVSSGLATQGQKTREKIVSLIKRGVSVDQISQELSMTKTNVWRHLRESGITYHKCRYCESPIYEDRVYYCSDVCYKNKKHDRWLKHKFGITKKQYDVILKIQGGGCVICGASDDLTVDHDHDTGEVRGILCRMCNSGIGMMRDNPVHLIRAAKYLKGT